MRKKKKPQSIAALGGRYLAAHSGRWYSYIIETATTDYRGVPLYRLQSLMHNWTTPSGEVKRLRASEKLWTEEELLFCGRILKREPSSEAIAKAKKKQSTG